MKKALLLLAVAATLAGAQPVDCGPGKVCPAAAFRSIPRPLGLFPACVSQREGELRYDETNAVYRSCTAGSWESLAFSSGLSSYVPVTRLVSAGSGLIGGGALSADITLSVDVIDDTQHGSRGGGSLHPNATTSVSGFMSETDKTKLDTYPSVYTPGSFDAGAYALKTITITGTGGLTGGGDLSASRTLDLSATNTTKLANTSGTNSGDVTLGTFGTSPNSSGASLSGQVLTLQPASSTQPGGVSTTTQTFAGNKTFSGTVSASNLSGTNSGNVTLTAVGSSPNANGASLSGQALTLQPASPSFPGLMSAADKTKLDSFDGGSVTAWQKPDYASSPASNVWTQFPDAGYSGFTKLGARARINQLGEVEIEGSIQRVSLVGPSSGEVMFRLPSSSMYPQNAGERIFRCASWAGAVGVHITGTDYASGAGWARIYDWTGSPQNAISLDGIHFDPRP